MNQVTEEDHEKQMGEALYVRRALEHALRELIAVRGLEYLEEFYAHEVARTGDQFVIPPIEGITAEADRLFSEKRRNLTRYGENELRRICDLLAEDSRLSR